MHLGKDNLLPYPHKNFRQKELPSSGKEEAYQNRASCLLPDILTLQLIMAIIDPTMMNFVDKIVFVFFFN